MWACPRALKRRSPIEAMPILTADQRAFFDQHGYLVVPELIEREQASPPAELTPLGRRLLGLDDW